MSVTQATADHNLSAHFKCPHCNTLLPSCAVFCSFCGTQVNAKENEVEDKYADLDAQEQNDDTVLMASISPKDLKRLRSSRSHKSRRIPKQSRTGNMSSRTTDVKVATAPLTSPRETEIVKDEWEDTQPRRKISPQNVSLESLPTTPLPSQPETEQKIPKTEVPAFLEKRTEQSSMVDEQVQLESLRSISQELTNSSIPVVGTDTEKQVVIQSPDFGWSWPTIIILSAVATYLVVFVIPGIVIRPIVVIGFLFICPGMMVVRFLQLNDSAVEWMLALALSFAIDALVASILLYAGRWSPTNTLGIVVSISLVGAIIQLAMLHSFKPSMFRLLRSQRR